MMIIIIITIFRSIAHKEKMDALHTAIESNNPKLKQKQKIMHVEVATVSSDGERRDPEMEQKLAQQKYEDNKVGGEFRQLHLMKEPTPEQKARSLRKWNRGIHAEWSSNTGFPCLSGIDTVTSASGNVLKVRTVLYCTVL